VSALTIGKPHPNVATQPAVPLPASAASEMQPWYLLCVLLAVTSALVAVAMPVLLALVFVTPPLQCQLIP
jgi:hypothetical protein